MAGVAVIGAGSRVRGWVLSGALVHPAETAEETRRAWRELGPEVSLVVLTERAARYLRTELGQPGAPLVAVMPS